MCKFLCLQVVCITKQVGTDASRVAFSLFLLPRNCQIEAHVDLLLDVSCHGGTIKTSYAWTHPWTWTLWLHFSLGLAFGKMSQSQIMNMHVSRSKVLSTPGRIRQSKPTDDAKRRTDIWFSPFKSWFWLGIQNKSTKRRMHHHHLFWAQLGSGSHCRCRRKEREESSLPSEILFPFDNREEEPDNRRRWRKKESIYK